MIFFTLNNIITLNVPSRGHILPFIMSFQPSNRKLTRTLSAPPHSNDIKNNILEEDNAYLKLQVSLLLKELNTYKKENSMLRQQIKYNQTNNKTKEKKTDKTDNEDNTEILVII